MATQSENPAEVAEELETLNEVENHSERPAETAEDHNSPLMTAMKLLARQMNITGEKGQECSPEAEETRAKS